MNKQYYKSLYFSDYPSENTNEKSVTIAFSDSEIAYYSKIKSMSTTELKELIGITTYSEVSAIACGEDRSINQVLKRLIKQNLTQTDFDKRDVTFNNSKHLPFQRWYPYIEGYSPDFVKTIISRYKIKDVVIYEPFAGTGTTIFAADQLGLKTLYSEVNPLLLFLIETKTKALRLNDFDRISLSQSLIEISEHLLNDIENFQESPDLKESYVRIFESSPYFPANTYSQILRLRSYIDTLYSENKTLLADLLSIAVCSSLLSVSYMKKNGDVRFKTQKEIENGEVKTLETTLPTQIKAMAEDLSNLEYSLQTHPEFIISNAKATNHLNGLRIGAIITSPPYLNGTNYFRNTKIELWFLKFLQSSADLRHYRDQALTSGINDVKKEYALLNIDPVLSKSKLLTQTIAELEKNAYDKRIPLMAKCYFYEMYQVFHNIIPSLENNCKVLIDLGDSIFGGIHIETDKILIEVLESVGYHFIESHTLRKRKSKNNEILSQVLLFFNYQKPKTPDQQIHYDFYWKGGWDDFKTKLPHQNIPYSKKNWGHPNHSLCSYQGKLKPAIAHHLVRTFVPERGRFLDPFSGVGTIPFEGALNGIKAFGIDISKPAFYVSSAKVSTCDEEKCHEVIDDLETYIHNGNIDSSELEKWINFGFNKKLIDYYEETTFKEILLAREFFRENAPKTAEEMLVISSLLHILHGNRPYALSRRSHPIVPYAPTGDFKYKNLIEKLKEKVFKSLNTTLPDNFVDGTIYNQDATGLWPQEINNLDAVITSPPFFDSTRFYLANWIRIWFAGWDENDFRIKPQSFVEEKQKINFAIYESIFRQARERLKDGGVFVLHLGKSSKCDMAKELQKISKRWFNTADLFDENVTHCQKHGISDMGTVTSHQYLIMV